MVPIPTPISPFTIGRRIPSIARRNVIARVSESRRAASKPMSSRKRQRIPLYPAAKAGAIGSNPSGPATYPITIEPISNTTELLRKTSCKSWLRLPAPFSRASERPEMIAGVSISASTATMNAAAGSPAPLNICSAVMKVTRLTEP